MGILICVRLPTFRDPTSKYKMLGLEIFPHPTCEVRGSGDCECLHPTSHMASEKWEVGLEREFPFLKYLPLVGRPIHCFKMAFRLFLSFFRWKDIPYAFVINTACHFLESYLQV